MTWLEFGWTVIRKSTCPVSIIFLSFTIHRIFKYLTDISRDIFQVQKDISKLKINDEFLERKIDHSINDLKNQIETHKAEKKTWKQKNTQQ